MTFNNALLIAVLAAFCLSATASDLRSVNHQTQTLLTGIEDWNGTQLKDMLTQRIHDNQKLIDVIQNNQDSLVKTEVDQDYSMFLKSLLEDQKALVMVTEYLANIDTQRRLHLDIYLSRKPALKAKIERILSHNLHTRSSRNVVNQVLYFTLMEKYAGR